MGKELLKIVKHVCNMATFQKKAALESGLEKIKIAFSDI
jgi:hypothetical protein